MVMDTRICIFVALLFAQHVAANDVSNDGNIRAQSWKIGAVLERHDSSPSGKQLNAAIRAAIYKDRKELMEYLKNPRTRSLICTPVLNDSYELFQESIREELDVLWDLDIYATKYSLNKQERQSVKVCTAQMVKYLDNFKLWQKLSQANKE